VIDHLRERISVGLADAVGAVTGQPISPPPVQDPPRPEMGDLASPVALQAAKRAGANPREMATRLVDYLTANPIEGVGEWTIAGPGFLNARLDRATVLTELMRGVLEPGQERRHEKVIVEHTSINPNKAAHIGHLRNSVLGDTLARVFRREGFPTEVHNYIDDTGVQVADVVIGFLDLRAMSAEQVRELPEPFDFLCWDLYTEVSRRLDGDEALRQRRRDVLLALEENKGPEAEIAAVVVDRIVARHLGTMRRLGIEYDVLIREGDVLALDLWADAFERLRSSDNVYFAEEGKHEGCWMMHLAGTEGFSELEEADKVLVRSNGVATYVAKDIAYHFWKFGLLERDFRYVPVPGVPSNADGGRVWESKRAGGEERGYGHADRAVTVIDVRQSYLQAIVQQSFFVVGEPEAGRNLTHFAYEMVALSPRTAKALGIPIGEDAEDRQFVEMSGRKGYGVKADELLDELVRRASEEVGDRNPELAAEERDAIGRAIAIGAARYFLLKFSRNTVIVFDLEEALAFEGETGPYIQYAAVRAAHIFDRLRSQAGVDPDAVVESVLNGNSAEVPEPVEARAVAERLEQDEGELWSLILALGKLDEVVRQARDSMEVAVLARYAFSLAQHFNRFYHGYPILQADDPADRALRILVADAFRRQLQAVVGVMGIPVPERM
jgi:arginyl-tRNA synthetase